MASDKMTLLLVLHAHQPVGNFDHVMAHAFATCYEPVVKTLQEYPEFRCGLHYSGPLLNWLKKNEPGYLKQVAELSQSGQVEMLTGGYYEPLLASIPKRDARAQIFKHTEFTKQTFESTPKGLWLAERIWEPGLPAKIGGMGLEYTLVDDTHLYYAGLGPESMFGYHLTEREGFGLGVFPTHKELRYSIPFKEPSVTLDFLKRVLDSKGSTCATYGDDMEKFGLWPETWDWVFKRGWLKRFIEAVLDASDWLRLGHCGQWVSENPPEGRIYMPTAAYEEMLTWALPSRTAAKMEELTKELKQRGEFEEMRPFLRGGIWDNFLVKYRESNLMHKRMLFVSQKLANMNAPKKALDHLYQAQCNCAYWHGLFGGLYLAHLRAAVHEHLIKADTLADQALQGKADWAECRALDLDLDGREEVVLAGPYLDAVIHSSYGGSVSLLDLRPQAFNLGLGLTRRHEAYHELLTMTGDEGDLEGEVQSIHDRVVFKEENLEKHLIYDWYERALFQDHILPEETGVKDMPGLMFREWGDFVNQPYEVLEKGKAKQRAWLRLLRKGGIYNDGESWPLTVEKGFSLGPGALFSVDYIVNGPDKGRPGVLFVVEINFSLLAANDPGKHILLPDNEKMGLDSPWEKGPVSSLELVNQADGFRVRLSLNPPALLWCYPVETVSQSESGLERTYQGSSLNLVWPFAANREKFSAGIDLEVM
jgi:alpha-amylase